MVDALEARDGARLAAILRAHLMQKCDAVIDAIRGDSAVRAKRGDGHARA
jgi:DNA-binding GntR family transcriptional regulator